MTPARLRRIARYGRRCCAAAFQFSLCRLGVISGKARGEQIASGLLLGAGIVDAFRHVRLVPTRTSAALHSITSSARAGASAPAGFGGRVCTGIRPACSAALGWRGLSAPPAPAHPVGRSVEHPRSGIVRSPEELMERPGDIAVQGRIGVAENDPDRASELFQLGDHLCARPDRGQ